MDAVAHHEVEAAAERLLDRIADDIVDDAKRFAPVETGHLRDSIGRGPVVGGRVEIKADADYAAFVELGHRIVAWGNDTGKFQPAQPFLRPALLQRRDDL